MESGPKKKLTSWTPILRHCGEGGEFLQQTLSGLFTVYFCLRLLFCECNLGPADLPKKQFILQIFLYIEAIFDHETVPKRANLQCFFSTKIEQGGVVKGQGSGQCPLDTDSYSQE